MFKAFRMISFLEGCSYLLLLFIAMPAKYFYGFPAAVSVMGAAHGFLFMAYVLLLVDVSGRQRWTFMQTLWLFIASLVPFAFLLVEHQLRKMQSTPALVVNKNS